MTTQRKTSFGGLIGQNKIYFLFYLLLLLVGAFFLGRLAQGDENLFFVPYRTSVWDSVFKYATQLAEPIAVLVVFLILLLKSYRKAASFALAMGVTLLVAWLAKLFFKHNRPSLYFFKTHRPDALVPVEGVKLLTGDSSFPSGHTMAAFTIFTLLALYTRQKKWGFLFIALAASVGLSRIYLGQHFLKDVVAGSIFGVLIAFVFYALFERLRNHPKWNKGLLKKTAHYEKTK